MSHTVKPNLGWISKTDSQQGPTVEHRGLSQCHVAAWMGRKFRGECVCMARLPKQVKNLSVNTGDVFSVPGSRRSSGGRHCNPLQCSCLENPMTEEPGRLQSMGSHRVEHHSASNSFTFTFKGVQIKRTMPLMKHPLLI